MALIFQCKYSAISPIILPLAFKSAVWIFVNRCIILKASGSVIHKKDRVLFICNDSICLHRLLAALQRDYSSVLFPFVTSLTFQYLTPQYASWNRLTYDIRLLTFNLNGCSTAPGDPSIYSLSRGLWSRGDNEIALFHSSGGQNHESMAAVRGTRPLVSVVKNE